MVKGLTSENADQFWAEWERRKGDGERKDAGPQ